MPILAGIIFLVGFLFVSNRNEGDMILKSGRKMLYDLADIDPDDQSGGYKKDHDFAFEKASVKWQVPFALLKAHAIKESSLNPRAFMDENPTKRTDRIGWASRGLMQVLWWPGSNRFAKYGYPDSILAGGEKLFDPEVGCDIGAQIIRDNLKACGGNLRDAVNMYNTGKKEAAYPAPGEYVNKVLNYYNKIRGV